MPARQRRQSMINYRVQAIPASVGKPFICQHHYSGGVHNGPTCYGLFDGDVLTGVAAFATPCSENVRASVFGPDHKRNVTELNRLVILDDTPKNTESWFISRALKTLKQDRPDFWAVLSFADPTEGHRGTIYQATNALYCGKSHPAVFYRDGEGRLRHPRQNGVNISRADAAEMGWTPEKRLGKHRYLFLLPNDRRHARALRNALRLPALPYP